MLRLVLLVSVLAVASPRSVKNDLVFLTRDGCVNTPDMVNNLDVNATAGMLSSSASSFRLPFGGNNGARDMTDVKILNRRLDDPSCGR